MKATQGKRLRVALLAAIAASGVIGLVSCGGGNESSNTPVNVKPSFVGTVTVTHFDGVSDDLLTAGLGASGLASATAPTVASPTAPTAAELCRVSAGAEAASFSPPISFDMGLSPPPLPFFSPWVEPLGRNLKLLSLTLFIDFPCTQIRTPERVFPV